MTYAQKIEGGERKKENVPCCDTCSGEPNYYIGEGKRFLCLPCFIGTSNLHSRSTRVDYQVHRDELIILCKEHSTCAATHLCCDELVCMYCVNRGHHKDHPTKKTLSETEKSLREQISEKRMDTNAFWLCWSASDTERKILEKEVDKVVVVKKLKCLSDYLEFLDKKEDALKMHLYQAMAEHIKDTDPARHLSDCADMNSSYFLLERENILASIKKLSDGVVVPHSTLQLSLSEPQVRDPDHPLGELTTTQVQSTGTIWNTTITTNAKYFDNTITTGTDPNHYSKPLQRQINDMSLRCCDSWPISSVCEVTETEDGKTGIYLSMSVERFSKKERFCEVGEGIEFGTHTWSLFLKGRDENVNMVIKCRPPSTDRFEAMVVVRNKRKVYSMAHLSALDGNQGSLCHFLNTRGWDGRRGSVETTDDDCVTFEALVHIIPPERISADRDDTPLAGGKRKR